MSGAPILYVTIPGEPVAAARPRVTKYGTHNPPRYRRWKAAAARRLGRLADSAAELRAEVAEQRRPGLTLIEGGADVG